MIFKLRNKLLIHQNQIINSYLKLNYHHKSPIYVFNTLTKNKKEIEFKNENTLYWYSCGPTVYDSAHLGHARYLHLLP
jgi:hypothetical protein